MSQKGYYVGLNAQQTTTGTNFILKGKLPVGQVAQLITAHFPEYCLDEECFPDPRVKRRQDEEDARRLGGKLRKMLHLMCLCFSINNAFVHLARSSECSHIYQKMKLWYVPLEYTACSLLATLFGSHFCTPSILERLMATPGHIRFCASYGHTVTQYPAGEEQHRRAWKAAERIRAGGLGLTMALHHQKLTATLSATHPSVSADPERRADGRKRLEERVYAELRRLRAALGIDASLASENLKEISAAFLEEYPHLRTIPPGEALPSLLDDLPRQVITAICEHSGFKESALQVDMSPAAAAAAAPDEVDTSLAEAFSEMKVGEGPAIQGEGEEAGDLKMFEPRNNVTFDYNCLALVAAENRARSEVEANFRKWTISFKQSALYFYITKQDLRCRVSMAKLRWVRWQHYNFEGDPHLRIFFFLYWPPMMEACQLRKGKRRKTWGTAATTSAEYASALQIEVIMKFADGEARQECADELEGLRDISILGTAIDACEGALPAAASDTTLLDTKEWKERQTAAQREENRAHGMAWVRAYNECRIQGDLDGVRDLVGRCEDILAMFLSWQQGKHLFGDENPDIHWWQHDGSNSNRSEGRQQCHCANCGARVVVAGHPKWHGENWKTAGQCDHLQMANWCTVARDGSLSRVHCSCNQPGKAPALRPALATPLPMPPASKEASP